VKAITQCILVLNACAETKAIPHSTSELIGSFHFFFYSLKKGKQGLLKKGKAGNRTGGY
jgi:hypothetical protein